MLQKGVLDGLIFFQDKNERYSYEYHMLEGAEIEQESKRNVYNKKNEKFDPYKTCGANSCHDYYDGHSVSSTLSTDEKDENDDEILQKYLGDTIWEDQDDFVKNDETVDPCFLFQRAEPNHDLLKREKDFTNSNSIKRTSTSISHTAPSFLQPKKRRKKQGGMKFHLASTLNFPYKEGLSSRSSSVKEGIWQDQGDQAEMFEKHFNSAWQCQFMIDFYGIGGNCHSYHNGDSTNRWNLKREENHFEMSKKENNAILFNRDLSKDTTLNSNMVSPAFADDKCVLVHSCRETKQRDKNLNDGIYCYTEEDLKSATVKLLEAMDLTDDSRTKVFRIEESMNINRTKYLRDFRTRMMK